MCNEKYRPLNDANIKKTKQKKNNNNNIILLTQFLEVLKSVPGWFLVVFFATPPVPASEV